MIIGEMGGLYKDKDKEWQDWAIHYLKNEGIGLFYFSLNGGSKDTGGLLKAVCHRHANTGPLTVSLP